MACDREVVLSLCDYTGNAVRPWVNAGYLAWIVDLRHGKPGDVNRGPDGVIRVGADLFRGPWGGHWRYGFRPAFVFAWPPCTHLASSGARWWKGKGLRALSDAIRIVASCAEDCEDAGCPYLIENPVGALSTHWRKPDHYFDPCDYAGYLDDPSPEAYTKRTCLWVGGGFVMPAPRRVEPVLGSKMHTLPSSDNRAEIRSETPRGFAKAVFLANHKEKP